MGILRGSERVKWHVIASSINVVLTAVVCLVLGHNMLLVQIADDQLAIVRDGKQAIASFGIRHGPHIVLMIINRVERIYYTRILAAFSRLDLWERTDISLRDLPQFYRCIIRARQ